MENGSINTVVLLSFLLPIICVVAVIAISGMVFGKKRKFGFGGLFKNQSNLADTQDDSEILAFYTQGHMLALADRGTSNGMNYSTYATIMNDVTATKLADDTMSVIHVLDLPFNTNTHLIGLTKQHKIDRVQFGNFVKSNGMMPIVLEGDFRDYFDLYSAKDQDIEAREIMNPKSMAYVVDYCKSHFWEINRSELYIVANNKDTSSGNIYAEAQQFVTQIKPALRPGDPGAPIVHHAIPYGEYEGPPLKCPVCSKEMSSNKLWHTCPDSHGILITGRELQGLKNHQISISSDPPKTQSHGQLSCPNCQYKMVDVDFDMDKNIKIDTCTNCPYRWLDAEEIFQISKRDEDSQNKLKDILGTQDPIDKIRAENDQPEDPGDHNLSTGTFFKL